MECTYRPVGALLACVFASTAVHLNVYIIDDLEEILDDGHSFVAFVFIAIDC